MAISNIGSGSSGRRKSLDTEVNLVPFIDLLSMCICFLLVAAVWTELGSVQVKQANGTEAVAQTQATDLNLKFNGTDSLDLEIKKSGKVVKKYTLSGADLLPQFNKQLLQIKDELTKQGIKVSAVMITPVEGVSYGELVTFMDAFRQQEMVNIGIIPVKPIGGSVHASR